MSIHPTTFLLLATALTAVNSFSTPPTLAARLSLEGDGFLFTTGDFNSDGNEDIISVVPVSNSPASDYELSVQLGNGNGAFIPGLKFDLGPNFVPTAIGAVDVDGNGLLDVVVLSPSTNSLYVVLQRKGKYPIITPFEILNASGATNIGFGDLNGDGLPDIVIPTNAGTNVLLNEGRGNFRSPVIVNTLPETFVVLGDVNNDGILDLVLNGSCCNGSVVVLLGDGHGGFSLDSFPLAGGKTELSVADFDQDGNLDIAVTSVGGSFISFGDGTGNFFSAENIPLPSEFPNGIGVASGDVNGDGLPDLIVLASGSTGTSILTFLNQGQASFGASTTYEVQGSGSSVQIAPLVSQATGNAGLALVPAPPTQVISVFVNIGTGFLEGSLVGPSVPATNLVIGDFNGDGREDIATISSDGLTVLLNTGEGTRFYPKTTLPFSSGLLVAGDFTQDGRLDLVNISGASGELLIGEGTGQFRLKLPPFSVGLSAAAALAADMNGDGKLDLVTSAPAILLGTGTGNFQAPYIPPAGTCGSKVLAVADFNADGKLDVVSACEGSLMVFPGNGDGTLGSPLTVGTDANGITGAVAGDFNNDGIPDIAFTSTFYGPGSLATTVYIELGNGDGTFRPTGPYLTPLAGAASTPFSIATGSFNRDGNLDLAVLDEGDSLVAILPGNGDGTFALPVLYETGSNPTCIASAPLQNPMRASREALVFCSGQGVSIDLNRTK